MSGQTALLQKIIKKLEEQNETLSKQNKELNEKLDKHITDMDDRLTLMATQLETIMANKTTKRSSSNKTAVGDKKVKKSMNIMSFFKSDYAANEGEYLQCITEKGMDTVAEFIKTTREDIDNNKKYAKKTDEEKLKLLAGKVYSKFLAKKSATHNANLYSFLEGRKNSDNHSQENNKPVNNPN